MSESELPPIRIATRASRLALWQADHVAGLIRSAAPGCSVEIVHISTLGDRDQSEPLQAFGGFGVFTREVQKAVLDQRADIAVHSLKDLPTEVTPGLCLAAVPERADVADALVLPASSSGDFDLHSLPQQARVGTGSLRRQAQLLHVRPDFQLREVRGNVETRLRKLDEGEYDALVLAAAGLTRLGLQNRISRLIVPPVMFSAVGQGALGIECRDTDLALREILSKIDDPATHSAVTAERALLAELRAGCHAPVGVITRAEGEELILEGVVLSPDGRQRLHAIGKRVEAEALELGVSVANELRVQGAEALMRKQG